MSLQTLPAGQLQTIISFLVPSSTSFPGEKINKTIRDGRSTEASQENLSESESLIFVSKRLVLQKACILLPHLLSTLSFSSPFLLLPLALFSFVGFLCSFGSFQSYLHCIASFRFSLTQPILARRSRALPPYLLQSYLGGSKQLKDIKTNMLKVYGCFEHLC